MEQHIVEEIVNFLEPTVLAFACNMQLKLNMNKEKKGDRWKQDDIDTLIERLEEEVDELKESWDNNRSNMHTAQEALDVANFAYFICERMYFLDHPTEAA